jgi:hypothetical protein
VNEESPLVTAFAAQPMVLEAKAKVAVATSGPGRTGEALPLASIVGDDVKEADGLLDAKLARAEADGLLEAKLALAEADAGGDPTASTDGPPVGLTVAVADADADAPPARAVEATEATPTASTTASTRPMPGSTPGAMPTRAVVGLSPIRMNAATARLDRSALTSRASRSLSSRCAMAPSSGP